MLKGVYKIFRKAHIHTFISATLKHILLTTPRVPFRNIKSINGKIVRKLENSNERDPGNHK